MGLTKITLNEAMLRLFACITWQEVYCIQLRLLID